MATQKQIEAAARAMWDRTPHRPNWTWDDLHPHFDKSHWIRQAEAALAAAEAAAWEPLLEKRPAAFRVRAKHNKDGFLFTSEQEAIACAERIGVDYEGLYSRRPLPPPSSATGAG